MRPTISAVGGLRTENGTRGWFGANLGTWRGGRVRTIAALADMDVNLEFFGLGGDAATATQGLGYSVKARGGVAGGNYRLGDTQLWMGLRYTAVDTRVSLETSVVELPNVPLDDYDLRLGALTPSLTLDRRDNFFTPIRGWYVDLSVPMYRESLGSDRDFETANLTGMYFRPFADSLFFSLRASGKYSSDRTPFFLRPYVSLRGVQALEYQGERTADLKRSSVGNSAHAGASSVSSAQAKPVARRGTRTRDERLDGWSRISILDRAPPWLAPRSRRSGRPRRRHLLRRVRQRLATAVERGEYLHATASRTSARTALQCPG